VPGSVFYKDQQQSSYARLNFTNATPQDIKTGMKRLKKAYKSYE
jgi:DNA-binding transcriptional MocR family regulator